MSCEDHGKFVEHHILCHYIKHSAPEYENLPSILLTAYTNVSQCPTSYGTLNLLSPLPLSLKREKDPIQLQNVQD